MHSPVCTAVALQNHALRGSTVLMASLTLTQLVGV